jgi:hypothetical protein
MNPITSPTSVLNQQNTTMMLMNKKKLLSIGSIHNFDPPVFLKKNHFDDASSDDGALHSCIATATATNTNTNTTTATNTNTTTRTSTCNKDEATTTGDLDDSAVHSHEQRKVTFAQSVITEQIPRYDNDLYHDEIPSSQQCWYNDADYERIHQDNMETIRFVHQQESGLLPMITESTANHCRRGLEEQFRDPAKSWCLESREEVMEELLDTQIDLWMEQDQGRATPEDHPRRLAEAYSVYSRQHAVRAVVMGLHDWSAVQSTSTTGASTATSTATSTLELLLLLQPTSRHR